jgi:hypothetical protein
MVLYFVTGSSGCGNCGKVAVLCEFSKRLWEQWENGGLFFHCFHSARQFPQPGSLAFSE